MVDHVKHFTVIMLRLPRVFIEGICGVSVLWHRTPYCDSPSLRFVRRCLRGKDLIQKTLLSIRASTGKRVAFLMPAP